MDIHVSDDGWLAWGENRVRCALGRGGVGDKGCEGDGITPVGCWPLRRIHYRADRLQISRTGLVRRPIAHIDGWCDGPECTDYNRRVRLPHDGSHERMWRDDGLYDIVIEIGFNDDPVVAGAGSAIFMHIARPDDAPTEGCVALNMEDMLELLKDCDGETRLVIGAPRK